MKLAWMGQYRDVVDALIHYCNIYAAAYKLEKMEYKGVLGITRSNFSKIVNRLVAKGLLEKSYLSGSRKEMKLRVNAFGRELYQDYSQEILRWHFAPMFRELDRIAPENYAAIHDALYAAMGGSSYLREAEAREEKSKG